MRWPIRGRFRFHKALNMRGMARCARTKSMVAYAPAESFPRTHWKGQVRNFGFDADVQRDPVPSSEDRGSGWRFGAPCGQPRKTGHVTVLLAKNLGVFRPHSLQPLRVNAQGCQDRRGDLRGIA